MTVSQTVSRKRGFAAMDQEQQRAIASKGGRAAHRKGTAHQFSSEEARKAGYLGGKVVSADREHMAAIGRKGGQRAGRAVDAERNAQTSGEYGTSADLPAAPQFKEYPQQAGDSPAVVLPHWRETLPKSSQPQGEEQDRKQPPEGRTATYVFSAQPEATDVASVMPRFPSKE